MAQAWFNHLSAGTGWASSCGTGPARGVDGNVVTVMREAGVEIPPWTPRAVNQAILAEADLVVVMGRDISPDAFAPKAVWNFRDPDDQNLESYRQLRDSIRGKVENLVTSSMAGREGSFLGAGIPEGDGREASLSPHTLAALQALHPMKRAQADIGACDFAILRRYPLKGMSMDLLLKLYDHLESCEACFEQVFQVCKERDAHLFLRAKGRKTLKRARPRVPRS